MTSLPMCAACGSNACTAFAGKLAPGLSVDPMCAVCKGPIELDRRHCDVCEACDDSDEREGGGKS